MTGCQSDYILCSHTLIVGHRGAMPLNNLRVDIMNKGYYNEYNITSYADDDDIIHGQSYAIRVSNIDFVTWKPNNELRNEIWMKLHTKSGKEIRVKVDREGLNEILATVGNDLVQFEDNNRNRNEYELEQRKKYGN
jgi:hypothetical protein|tara:strand:+ start:262 stop:669 length:408 start_codon:yes stop_codon:yes gene_type:complete